MGELADTTSFQTAWLQRAAIRPKKHREDIQQWLEHRSIIM